MSDEAMRKFEALCTRKKPVMHTRRLLVGHEYLASHIADMPKSEPVSVPRIAVEMARRLAYDNSDPLPPTAYRYVFYVEQGYIVTFAWIVWEETDDQHLSYIIGD